MIPKTAMIQTPVSASAVRSETRGQDNPNAKENKITVRDLNFFYGKAQALYDISLDIKEREWIQRALGEIRPVEEQRDGLIERLGARRCAYAAQRQREPVVGRARKHHP